MKRPLIQWRFSSRFPAHSPLCRLLNLFPSPSPPFTPAASSFRRLFPLFPPPPRPRPLFRRLFPGASTVAEGGAPGDCRFQPLTLLPEDHENGEPCNEYDYAACAEEDLDAYLESLPKSNRWTELEASCAWLDQANIRIEELDLTHGLPEHLAPRRHSKEFALRPSPQQQNHHSQLTSAPLPIPHHHASSSPGVPHGQSSSYSSSPGAPFDPIHNSSSSPGMPLAPLHQSSSSPRLPLAPIHQASFHHSSSSPGMLVHPSGVPLTKFAVPEHSGVQYQPGVLYSHMDGADLGGSSGIYSAKFIDAEEEVTGVEIIGASNIVLGGGNPTPAGTAGYSSRHPNFGGSARFIAPKMAMHEQQHPRQHMPRQHQAFATPAIIEASAAIENKTAIIEASTAIEATEAAPSSTPRGDSVGTAGDDGGLNADAAANANRGHWREDEVIELVKAHVELDPEYHIMRGVQGSNYYGELYRILRAKFPDFRHTEGSVKTKLFRLKGQYLQLRDRIERSASAAPRNLPDWFVLLDTVMARESSNRQNATAANQQGSRLRMGTGGFGEGRKKRGAAARGAGMLSGPEASIAAAMAEKFAAAMGSAVTNACFQFEELTRELLENSCSQFEELSARLAENAAAQFEDVARELAANFVANQDVKRRRR
ncbi:unnamed protein product [Closterium sp. Naga37s-1]|nr:unnamed protein product [Closterium sp. Naga37s-1]